MVWTQGVAVPLAFLLASSAATEPGLGPWSHTRPITISLSNFAYTPSTVMLERDVPYVLHFTNMASGGHDFVANTFFARARIMPADEAKVSDGEVELRRGESMDVHLIAPVAGTYRVHCTHFMHSMLGMNGKIVVQ